jgi:hypothetical protein
MSAVAGSFVQDVDARAVRAHHLVILYTEEDPRVTQGTAVAGDRAIVDVKSFWGKSGAVRHFYPRSGGLRT